MATRICGGDDVESGMVARGFHGAVVDLLPVVVAARDPSDGSASPGVTRRSCGGVRWTWSRGEESGRQQVDAKSEILRLFEIFVRN
jgi:hypothetical protein